MIMEPITIIGVFKVFCVILILTFAIVSMFATLNKMAFKKNTVKMKRVYDSLNGLQVYEQYTVTTRILKHHVATILKLQDEGWEASPDA